MRKKYAKLVMYRELTAVVSTVEGAVLRACHWVGAERCIPGVAGVAVGRAASGVEPTPVGVEHDGALLGLAVVLGRALRDGDAGVVLRRQRADLLGVSGRQEGECEECRGGEHFDARSRVACRMATLSSMEMVDETGLLLYPSESIRIPGKYCNLDRGTHG